MKARHGNSGFYRTEPHGWREKGEGYISILSQVTLPPTKKRGKEKKTGIKKKIRCLSLLLLDGFNAWAGFIKRKKKKKDSGIIGSGFVP